MNRPAPFAFFIAIGALAVAGGYAFAHQWWEQAALRAEIAIARQDASGLEALREENQRLREKQISALELERLRADHAALPRLRAELEELKERASR